MLINVGSTWVLAILSYRKVMDLGLKTMDLGYGNYGFRLWNYGFRLWNYGFSQNYTYSQLLEMTSQLNISLLERSK